MGVSSFRLLLGYWLRKYRPDLRFFGDAPQSGSGLSLRSFQQMLVARVGQRFQKSDNRIDTRVIQSWAVFQFFQ